jgi:hypothetical protein
VRGSYHYKHFDELLVDIGATRRRRNPLAEKFTPPHADAYAQFGIRARLQRGRLSGAQCSPDR